MPQLPDTSARARRSARLGALGVVLALTLAGTAACASEDATATPDVTESDAAASEAAERVAAASAPLELELGLPEVPDGAAALAGKKVLVVPVASFVASAALKGVEEALAAVGAEATICDGKANPTEMSTCLESAVTLDVDAVITIAVSPAVAPNGYQAVADAGIPVFGGWQQLPTEATELLRFHDAAPALAHSMELSSDYFVASDADRSVFILGNSDDATLEALSDDWVDYTRSLCPECTLETESVATAQADQTKNIVSSQLLRDPDTGAILGFNIDTVGPEILNGLTAGTSVPLIGGNGSGGISVGLVDEGRIDFVVLTSLYYAGWVSVDGLIRLVAGAPEVEYPFAVRIIDESNVKDIDVSAAEEASFEWFGDAGFTEQFTASWGVR